MHFRCFPIRTMAILPLLRGGILFLLWFVGIFTFGGSALADSMAEELLFAGRISEAWTIAKREAEASPNDVAIQELYVDYILIRIG